MNRFLLLNEKCKNVIIVHHSYPKNPCVDGLLSAMIVSKLCEQSELTYVPYWRTDDSFEALKKTVGNVGFTNTSIIYVDCAPELPLEIEFLQKHSEDFDSVLVIDHHEPREDSLVHELKENKNVETYFDFDNCATKILYGHLSDKQKHELKVEKLVKIIQFSEYENMNSKLSCEPLVKAITSEIFEMVMESFEESNESLLAIQKLDLTHYFILDLILPKKDDKLMPIQSLDFKEKSKSFNEQSLKYLGRVKKILQGTCTKRFGKHNLENYLSLIQEMKSKLDKGWVCKSKRIGDKVNDIFVASINIFIYGRTLEPFIRQKMQDVGAQYAILMNTPTKNNDDKLSYYFSLRRLNEDYNAKHLANFCMEISGSSIGGGHPWSSGVSMTEEQFECFYKEIQ